MDQVIQALHNMFNSDSSAVAFLGVDDQQLTIDLVSKLSELFPDKKFDYSYHLAGQYWGVELGDEQDVPAKAELTKAAGIYIAELLEDITHEFGERTGERIFANAEFDPDFDYRTEDEALPGDHILWAIRHQQDNQGYMPWIDMSEEHRQFASDLHDKVCQPKRNSVS